MFKLPVPTEHAEQCALVEYLELKGLLFSATMQETYTMSIGQKMKHRRSGLKRGLPDMFVYLPEERVKTENAMLLAIEMKRTKGGVISPEQQVWIDSLQFVPGIAAAVCKGFDEARNFIEKYLK